MDIRTKLAHITLENPLLPASGPLTGTDRRMLDLAAQGVGALVTKTIAPEAAQVGRACIVGEGDIIANSEAWSEYPASTWTGEFLPRVREGTRVPVMASIGYSADDMKTLIPALEPFAAFYEVIPRYVGKDLAAVGEIVREARRHTEKPLFVKINANMPEPVEFAGVVAEAGAQGVVAITSLGPSMMMDLENRRPRIGIPGGFVWTSGPPLKPLALATVAQIRRAHPDITVIGCGGVVSAADVLEFLLAGADAVQMLSGAMLRGRQLYRKILADLPGALEKYGFSSVQEVRDTGLGEPRIRDAASPPKIDHATCTRCGRCVDNCPYMALGWQGRRDQVTVDAAECFGCGLCESRCPVRAIRGVLSDD